MTRNEGMATALTPRWYEGAAAVVAVYLDATPYVVSIEAVMEQQSAEAAEMARIWAQTEATIGQMDLNHDHDKIRSLIAETRRQTSAVLTWRQELRRLMTQAMADSNEQLAYFVHDLVMWAIALTGEFGSNPEEAIRLTELLLDLAESPMEKK